MKSLLLTLALLLNLAFTLSKPISKPPSTSRPAGYVYTNGTRFYLNGQPFYYAGSNAYWLPFLSDPSDVGESFQQMADAGLKVIRTWGFNDINSTAAANNPVYFQSWSKGKPTINYGPNGLQKLDYVVEQAGKAGIKLVITFTNNWSDYGGMDVYTTNVLPHALQTHDQFYTNSVIRTHYYNYIKAIVNRYKGNPTIMAWELGNEPRCVGSGQLPASSKCNTKSITNWAAETSAYIKSLDPQRLVTLGDEGFYNRPKTAWGSTWPYNGGEGVDFDANLKIPSLDYGTFHLYALDQWSLNQTFANQFIVDHAISAKTSGKPVVLEEYGITNVNAGLANITDYYVQWQDLVLQTDLAADHYWQFAPSNLKENLGLDNYAIYETSPAWSTIVKSHAAAMSAKNQILDYLSEYNKA